MEVRFFYYIFDNYFLSNSQLSISKKPIIIKVSINYPVLPKFNSENVYNAEGPYTSIYELKKKSFIFNNIKLQKHKQQVLYNIKLMTDHILMNKTDSFSFDFIKAFNHVTIGKIEKGTASGIHFYNPKKVKILQIIQKDYEHNVYKAKISIYDDNKKIWIEKEEPSSFFPDNWSLSLLFNEINYAYKNKIKDNENVYIGKTSNNLRVKFIVKSNKILTIYPII